MAQTLEEQFKAEQNKDNTGFIEIGENPFKEGAEKNVATPTVGGDGEQKEFKEITLKFPKGLVGDEFTGKDGQVYREIKIPNDIKGDKSPWLSFVAPASKIHEDKYAENGMWLKLPAEGSTTIKRDFIAHTDPATGKNEYQRESQKIPNTDLKKIMDEFKPKEKVSFKEKLSEKKETLAETLARRTKTKTKEDKSL